MEKDLIKAKKYLSEQGYGTGTNYTTNLVAVLLANYAAAPPPASEGDMAKDLIIFINSMKTKQTLTNGCEIETIHIPSLIHKINESLATLPTREPEGWISVKDRTPDLIEGEDYSENVWAICNGQRMIMCFCYNSSEDHNERGYFWANCYSDIDGNGEFDDDYDVTHWQPFPSLPTQSITN